MASTDDTLLPTGDYVRDVRKGRANTQVVLLDIGGLGAESLLTGTMPVTVASTPGQVPTGGATKVSVVGDDIESLLGKILKELKLVNIHLAAVSGEKINYSDIEG